MKQRNRFKTCLAATVVALLAASSLEATTYRYVTETGSGTKSGADWDNASDNLQTMINNSADFDQVWVAAGTYVPTGPDGFTLSNYVKVYGGFAGTEDPATFDPENDFRDFVNNKSTLDGDSMAKVVDADHVGRETVLDGFTITGATQYAIHNGSEASPTLRNLIVENNIGSSGAGMYSYYRCSPELVNCTFQDNTASSSGGAAYNDTQCTPLFDNCLFDNNTCQYGSGGAILEGSQSYSSCNNCVFSGNTAGGNGGAIWHSASNDPNSCLSLRHCTFELNQANQGGAVNLEGQTAKTIEIAHCSFDHNVAGPNNGGAINIGNSSTSVQIASCTFESCTANQSNGSGMGGAINTRGILSVVNSVFSENQALREGGAIYCVGGSSTTIVNCTFAGNTADDAAGLGGGGLFASSSADTNIHNSIFWDNTANGSTGEANQLTLDDTYTLSHTCIQNLTSGLIGTNLFNDNPQFLGGSGSDALSLSGTSPCIDRGLAGFVPPDALDADEDADTTERTPDLLLHHRLQDIPSVGGSGSMVVDLGAFEMQWEFDCDGDSLPDELGDDCNENGVPDECDVDETDPDGNGHVSADCNANGVPDLCDVAELDCNENGVPDDCDVDVTDPDGDLQVSPDCNANGIPDFCDAAELDCNGNGVPDECDVDVTDPDGNNDISDDCNQNTVPDECELVPCPTEIVFLVDTSGSSGGDGNVGLFCQHVALPLLNALDAIPDLTMRASYLAIVSGEDSDLCGVEAQWWIAGTSVLGWFQDETGSVPVPGDGSCGPIGTDQQTDGESWGPATAVVADGWDWLSLPHTRRIIITLSDAGACRGEPCDAQDVAAVLNAIDVASYNNVTTYCVCGNGAEQCVKTQAGMLADGTGGSSFSVAVGDVPGDTLGDRYAEVGNRLIAAIAETHGCHDCNDNGVIDECECTRGNMVDTDAPDLVNGYDIQDFVTCLINGDPSPDGCYCADMNDDLVLDMDDVPCFVELLIDGETSCTVNPCLSAAGEGQTEAMMASPDCNENGRTDSHDLILGISEDANGNGIPDECDIAAETSEDINTNGIPDESEPDLNGNGVPDDVDISTATSADVNSNGIPDEAEDCNGNGYPDEWEIAQSITADCNNNGTPDDCDDDCNGNGVPDDCEIDPTDPDGDGLVSPDCNGNGFPDACDFDWLLMFSLDCNENGIPDECDVASGTSQDCNNNGFPDECDIAAGISTDANTNGIPDECESLAAQSYASPLTEGSADETEAWIEFYTWHWSQQWGSASPLTGAEQFRLMVNKLQELGLPVDASSL